MIIPDRRSLPATLSDAAAVINPKPLPEDHLVAKYGSLRLTADVLRLCGHLLFEGERLVEGTTQSLHSMRRIRPRPGALA